MGICFFLYSGRMVKGLKFTSLLSFVLLSRCVAKGGYVFFSF